MSKLPVTTSFLQCVCMAFPVAMALWARWISICTSRMVICFNQMSCFWGQHPTLSICARNSSYVPTASPSRSRETAPLLTERGVQKGYLFHWETRNPSSTVQDFGITDMDWEEINQLQIRDWMLHGTFCPLCCSDGARLLQTCFNWLVCQY